MRFIEFRVWKCTQPDVYITRKQILLLSLLSDHNGRRIRLSRLCQVAFDRLNIGPFKLHYDSHVGFICQLIGHCDRPR